MGAYMKPHACHGAINIGQGPVEIINKCPVCGENDIGIPVLCPDLNMRISEPDVTGTIDKKHEDDENNNFTCYHLRLLGTAQAFVFHNCNL